MLNNTQCSRLAAGQLFIKDRFVPDKGMKVQIFGEVLSDRSAHGIITNIQFGSHHQCIGEMIPHVINAL